MQLPRKVLDKFSGYAFRQEYLCLADEVLSHPLHAYLVKNDKTLMEVTHQHLFVGYCPLIFAFPENHCHQPELEIRFSAELLPAGGTLTTSQSLAWLRLRQIKVQQMEGGPVYFYEGTAAHHRFIPAFNRFLNRINNRLYQQKAGNVYLNNKLYPQVQVGYAIPRRISLISLGLEGRFNLFPTDLHGAINDEQYIISLRQGGMACGQVQQAGTIVVSAVHPGLYRQVYSFGKNHMQPLKPRDAFLFSENSSEVLGLPLPQESAGYHELELQSWFDHGIHRVLLFRVINQFGGPGKQSLAHIHASYATWRLKHGFPGNYLLR